MASSARNHRWNGETVALSCAAAFSGAAIAAMPAGASLRWLCAGALVGFGAAVWLLQRGVLPCDPIRAPTPVVERIAPWVALLFFVPLATHAVAPGADMAMHSALARGLMEGGARLSPAWSDIQVPLYPRGLSALVALFAPAVGIARASLLAAGLAHGAFLFGLRAVFRDVLRTPWPGATAAVTLLLSVNPQAFFAWGGNPTVLAAGLGLWAAALVARAAGEGAGPARRTGMLVGMLLLGAMATHPIGAVLGAIVAAAVPLTVIARARARTGGTAVPSSPWQAMLTALGVGLAALAAGMIAAKLGGPALSARELEWIQSYQQTTERVLGTGGSVALNVLAAIPNVVGWLFAAVCAVAVAVAVGLASRAGRRRVAGSALACVAVLAVLAMGPRLPHIGMLAYPLRLAPLLLVALGPVLGFAAADLAAWRPGWVPAVSAAIVALIGVGVHVDHFQSRAAMATGNDLDAIECLARAAAPGSLVEGAYGDATQWVPALTGLPIRTPHAHCSLFDEIDEAADLAHRPAAFLFIGERLKYGAPTERPRPAELPICRFGGAAVWALPAEDVAASVR